MSRYMWTPSPTNPCTWFATGDISKDLAKRQFKELGFRYKNAETNELIIDYDEAIKTCEWNTGDEDED